MVGCFVNQEGHLAIPSDEAMATARVDPVPVFLSVFLFVFVVVCLFVCSFVRSFVRLFVCLFVCLFVSVGLFVFVLAGGLFAQI